MKQAHLIGRLKGLRHSQRRRLDSLLHRRHPLKNCADFSTLDRLAEEVVDLHQSLHLLIDLKGLSRFLCVGPLESSEQFLSYYPQKRVGAMRGLRLISCPFSTVRRGLDPDQRDSMVALELLPIFWLRFSPIAQTSGFKSASIWTLDQKGDRGWIVSEQKDLRALCEASLPEQISRNDVSVDRSSSQEKVLLLTLNSKDVSKSQRDLAELEGLVRSAGASPVSIVSQKQGSFNPQTIWGMGKLQEVALAVRRTDANLVIVDRELTPVQARNLERVLVCPVMDRSELILDIFAKRASTSTGRLQVELAQLRYRKPRLIGRGKSLSRQGGGIGTRGPGETKLEKDRRAIERRIERLVKELKQLKQHRSRIRQRRKNLPSAALVGYTNAGKSSLLNALCGLNSESKVFVENKLFATLDPATRRLVLPQACAAPKQVLITDTVGFIRELPETLMEAFQATLEQTIDADVLLLLVDLSNPNWRSHLKTVNQLLDSLNANTCRQVIANKIDCCESSSLEEISCMDNNVIYVSATSGAGLQGLKLWLYEKFWGVSSELPLMQNFKCEYE